ncbi:MAG: hypothetical protein EBQ92_07555 [Proteobacteria bacterium]|nr:hypothetical protein [Pseudomonadota bacterium]
MKKFSLLQILFYILLIPSASWGLSFLHPAFNRLDPIELKNLRTSEPKDKDIILYFEAEALYLRGKIHAAEGILNSLKESCREKRSPLEPIRREVVCFLSELGFGADANSVGLHFRKEEIQRVLKAIQGKAFSFEERAYLEGRILWQIPSALGGDPSKSLLGWESLRRLRPDLSCSDFFMSQIYKMQGNHQLSNRALKRALTHQPPDPRAQLFRQQADQSFESRFYFGVVGSPAGGVGILIGKRDERLWDTRRKLDVSISAQSRGVTLGRLSYEDRETWEPFILSGRLLASSEIDQFFGLGPQTKLTQLTEVSQARSEGSLGVRRWFSEVYVEAAIGWFLREPSSVSGFDTTNLSLRERQASLISSFEVGAGDRTATHAFIQVLAAAKGRASTHGFEVYRLGLERNIRIENNHLLHLATGLRAVTGQKPFGMLSQMSGNVLLPGVRSGRFRDEMAWHATGEWQWDVWREFTVAAFGNIASLGNSLDRLAHGRFLTGGGAALIVGKGSFRSRLEAGYFAGETVMLAGVQLFSE